MTKHIALITTGGTIEKTYDEASGRLENRRSIVHRMLRRLRLVDANVAVIELMSKDSLDMTEDDRRRIVEQVRIAGGDSAQPTHTTGIIVLHGTDTLTQTGERIFADLPRPRVPIVLTGAMRPFEMSRSDALQNLTEAMFAVGSLSPGVYCVAHGRALTFPGVFKDRTNGTFMKAPQ
ncbi:MAG: asparaginase domain-containing protein [Planctomycetota bacterium]|nr:asparaginase domain-containing protein [Planctomycetota bacterium]